MKKLLIFSIVAILTATAISQEQIKCLAITNLSDKLKTKIEYDKSTGIDIRRLNLDSIHADKHKARYTAVKDMSIIVPSAKMVTMVKPLFTKDENGSNVKVENTYINTYALHKHDLKNMIIDAVNTKQILVADLNPNTIYINRNAFSNIEVKNISINSINVKSFSISSIFPYSITLSNFGMLNSNIDDITSTLKILSPSIVNVYDVSKNINVAIIDNGKYSIDNNWSNVEVNEQTYAELAEMKLIYDFEKNYNKSIKSSTKLNDIRALDRHMYLKWINLLAESRKCKIEFIKNKTPWKIVGEAWIFDKKYNSDERLNIRKNLNFLKSKGYNAILIRFDCTEDKSQLLQLIDDIKTEEFQIFSTYVGIDTAMPKWQPYIEPEIIDSYFKIMMPASKGILLNWRTTSNHVRILPIEYFNWISMKARQHNSNILVYGEAYYGVIGPLHMTTLVYTIPENSTGIVINNMGYYGYNTKYIINSMFTAMIPGYKKLNKICQVIGVSPYYCSRPERKIDNLTLEKEYDYKDKVEKAFKRTGCNTITMLHDGVDDKYTMLFQNKSSKNAIYDTTDNIVYDTKIWKSILSTNVSK